MDDNESYEDFLSSRFAKGEPDNKEAATERFRNATPPSNPPRTLAQETAVGAAVRQGTNMAQIAADEAAFGLTRPVNTAIFGTGYALTDLISGYKGDTGDKGPLGVIGEAFGRAFEETDAELDQSAAELGPLGQLSAALLGGVAPGAPAAVIDRSLDAGKSLFNIVAPEAGDAMARFGRSAALGGSTAALQGYFQGDMTVEDMLLNGTFGAGMGGLMQKMLGDNALPYITNLKAAEGAVLRDIIDTGPNTAGNFNLGAIARAVDTGELGINNLLTARIGGSPNYRQWGKINDAIADYSMSGIDPRTLSTRQAADIEDQFVRVQRAVRDSIDTVNTRARDQFRFALDNPEGRKEALYENNSRLRDARTVYARMSATDTPDSLGNRPFNPPSMVEAIDARLRAMDNRTGQLDLSPEAIRMRNAFKDLIRGREVEAVARGMGNIPSKGVDDPRAPEIFPDELPMFRLLDARRSFSELLSPKMAFQNGVSRTELRAGKEILNAIDEQLNEITNNGFGLAKGAFADAMKVEEAFDLGKRIYDQRHIEVRDQEAFGKYYGEYVTDMLDEFVNSETPEVAAAFKAGFKQGMFDQTGRRGFLSEMRNFIGPADTAGNDFFRGKGENYALMKQILGDDDLNTVMRLYREGGPQEEYMSLLRDNLEAVGMSPDAVRKLSGLTEQRNAPFMPIESQLFVTQAARSLYSKMMKPADRQKAEVAMDLLMLNGDDLRDLISTGAKQAIGGQPINVGTRTGSVAGFSGFFSDDNSVREEERQSRETEQLREYFKTLGIEAGFE